MENLQKIKNILIAVITALIYSLWLYVNDRSGKSFLGNPKDEPFVNNMKGGAIGGKSIVANAVSHPQHGYTYSYVWDNSIDRVAHNVFIKITDEIINSEDSWSKVFGIPIIKVDASPRDPKYHITFSLVSREKMKKMGSPDTITDKHGKRKYSVFFSWTYINSRKVLIDQGNWNQIDEIADFNQMSQRQYRYYVINHELGHAIGYDHEELPETKCEEKLEKINRPKHRTFTNIQEEKLYEKEEDDENSRDPRPRAPVMYQQTRGVFSCYKPSYYITKEDGMAAI